MTIQATAVLYSVNVNKIQPSAGFNTLVNDVNGFSAIMEQPGGLQNNRGLYVSKKCKNDALLVSFCPNAMQGKHNF